MSVEVTRWNKELTGFSPCFFKTGANDASVEMNHHKANEASKRLAGT